MRWGLCNSTTTLFLTPKEIPEDGIYLCVIYLLSLTHSKGHKQKIITKKCACLSIYLSLFLPSAEMNVKELCMRVYKQILVSGKAVNA